MLLGVKVTYELVKTFTDNNEIIHRSHQPRQRHQPRCHHADDKQPEWRLQQPVEFEIVRTEK